MQFKGCGLYKVKTCDLLQIATKSQYGGLIKRTKVGLAMSLNGIWDFL